MKRSTGEQTTLGDLRRVDRYRQRMAHVLRDPKDISALTCNNKKAQKKKRQSRATSANIDCRDFGPVLSILRGFLDR